MKYLIALIFFTSCSFLGSKKDSLKKDNAVYNQVEENGKYVAVRDSGFTSSKSFVVKTSVKNDLKSDLYLEKNVTISDVQSITKKVRALLPRKSESVYYLNGKRYSTRMNLEKYEGKIVVRMVSPEAQWNGEKVFDIPKGNGNLCFYSSVVECSIVTGFLKQAIKNGGGKMNFTLIWESYPYFQEQFINIPSEPTSIANIVYDGVNRLGQHRLTLEAGGQSQFYFINKKFEIVKHIWAAQGFTRERNNQ